MSVTLNAPNTIFLAGERTKENRYEAGAAITPGHLIELYVPSGAINRWRKHSTAGGAGSTAVATEQSMQNLGVDNDYATGDLVEASYLQTGAVAWMLIKSGQSIVVGQKLESAGDGTLRAIASGVAMFESLETSGAVVALTRLRVSRV